MSVRNPVLIRAYFQHLTAGVIKPSVGRPASFEIGKDRFLPASIKPAGSKKHNLGAFQPETPSA
jgi:hypothetical protein